MDLQKLLDIEGTEMLTPKRLREIYTLTAFPQGWSSATQYQVADAVDELLTDRAELAGELREIAKQGIALGLGAEPWMAHQLRAILARLEGK